MARSKYIYFVRKASLERELLGAFTVKHEAITWAFNEGWLSTSGDVEYANLSRMRDGTYCDKIEESIPWAKERAA